MKLRIWEEGIEAEADTCYFHFQPDVIDSDILDLNIVTSRGHHKWFVLSVSKKGLELHPSLPPPNSISGPLPFPLNKEERIALYNPDLVTLEVE